MAHPFTAIRRMALCVFILSLAWVSQSLLGQESLTVDQPQTQTLSGTPDHYTLPSHIKTPFVIEISGLDVYAYLSSGDQPLSPFATETQTQNAMIISRLAYTSAPANTQITVEGTGDYTLRLRENAVIGSTIAVLRSGDVIDDELLSGESHRYLIDTEDSSLITLTVQTKQRSFYARIVNGQGETLTPLLSLPDAEGFRELVALRGEGPYSLYLFGVGDYRASWEAGDTLSTQTSSLTFDTPVKAPAGGGHYTFATDTAVISVVLDEIDAETSLFDQTGHPVAAANRFYDQAARQRVVVYPLTHESPYTLMVRSANTYTVTLQDGDASQVDLGALTVNGTTSATVAAGRTPVYTLASPVDEVILTLFYDPAALRSSPPFTLVSSDGQTTQPRRIWGGAGQIQAFLAPQGVPPYRLALALSGKFSLSLVQKQTAGVDVTLTTIDTNLRSGPTLNAAVLRKGQPGERYSAIGRSADDAWVLLLTPDDTALWVYRQLLDTAPGTTLVTLPVVQTASLGAEPSATQTTVSVEASSVAAPTATLTSAPTELTATAATPRAVICRIVSQGGVNVRRSPSIQGDVAGSLPDGQLADVIGQAQDQAGGVWWQLSSGNWVRADVVAEQGDCSSAPTVVLPR